MDVSHFINQISSFISILPPDSAALFISALSTSLGTQGFKKFLNLQNDHVIVLVMATLSALTAGIPYITNVAGQNPSAFGAHTLEIAGLCTFIYRAAQFANTYLSKYQISRKEDEAAADAINGIGGSDGVATPAAVPATPALQPATVPSSNEFEG